MDTTQRAAFEAWAESAGIWIGSYDDAFLAWQASRKQMAEEAIAACEQLVMALDGGGNLYRREGNASQCVLAIRQLSTPEGGL